MLHTPFCISKLLPLNRLVADLDELNTVLVAECEVAVKFEKEYEELNVWLTDTRSMLEVTGSPSSAGTTMGVTASPALLRGKHQVRGAGFCFAVQGGEILIRGGRSVPAKGSGFSIQRGGGRSYRSILSLTLS